MKPSYSLLFIAIYYSLTYGVGYFLHKKGVVKYPLETTSEWFMALFAVVDFITALSSQETTFLEMVFTIIVVITNIFLISSVIEKLDEKWFPHKEQEEGH